MTDIGTDTAIAAPPKNGKVKWFSKDKGYGFITDGDDQDYYFSVKDVIGQEIPNTGSSVSFHPEHNPKGKRATSIRIQALTPNPDSHVICPNCNKKMIPRIVFSEGSPHHSICPFCAKTYKKFINTWGSIVSFVVNIFFAGLKGR